MKNGTRPRVGGQGESGTPNWDAVQVEAAELAIARDVLFEKIDAPRLWQGQVT